MDRTGIRGRHYGELLMTGIAAGLMCFGIPVATAATAPYGASVYVEAGSSSNSDGGWGAYSAGVSLDTLYGKGSGTAGFYGASPAVSATADSAGFIPGYARAIAGINDQLVFSGSGNDWYSDVTLHISGNWSISLTPGVDNHGSAPWVRFSLGLTRQGTPLNTYDSWRSLVSGSVQSSQTYLDTVVTGAWSEIPDSNASFASGTYSFAFTTRVYDGWNYNLGLAVIAEAPSGASAYIDDPLVVQVPPGMVFTAASLNKYTVPLPPAFIFLASGVLGIAGMRPRSDA